MKRKIQKIVLSLAVAAIFTSSVGVITGCAQSDTVLLYDSAKNGIKAYEMLSLGFSSENPPVNPYDSSEIAMDALIERPDGVTDIVPMFWYQDYERSLRYDVEKLTPKGEAYWAVRYTPKQSGTYPFS